MLFVGSRRVIIGECYLVAGGEWKLNELPGVWKRVIIGECCWEASTYQISVNFIK